MSQFPASRLATSVAGVFLLSLLVPTVAADNVQNDVVAGGNDTVDVDEATTITYRIVATGGDGESNCNAKVASPAVLSILAPAAVVATPSSLTFTACGNPGQQSVVFNSSVPGDHFIPVSIADGGPGTYKIQANFTLHVLEPPDTDLPSIEASVSPDLDGWHNLATGAPTISFACSDASSAIVFCSPSVTLGAGTGQMVTGRAEDAAGNEVSIDVGPFDVDLAAPSISASLSPDVPESGWYNLASGAPTASFECSDDLSTPSCPDDVVLGEGAGQFATGHAQDAAGNSASASTSPVDIDLTPPSISADLPADGWYNLESGAPSASFQCSDALSGLASCPAAQPLDDGAGQLIDGTAWDVAGNNASAQAGPFDVDLTAPSIEASISPALPASGWYNIASGAPTVHFECSDSPSGIASCSGDEVLGEGSAQSATGFAEDVAGNGNSASSDPVDVDLTAPSISASLSPAEPAASGWYNLATGAPTAHFECSDSLSLIASCSEDEALGEGEAQSADGSAEDNAGNSASATAGPVDVDLTAPSISASLSPDPASSGWYNLATGAPASSFQCSDGLSGVASCPSGIELGEGLDQSHEATAYDNAGNPANATAGPADVDLTAPSISPSLSPAPAPSGWYNIATGAPTASFACSDALSGIASCTAPSALGEGLAQSLQGFAADVAGNQANATAGPADVDLTRPALGLPADFTVLATGVGGGPASFSVSASDNLDGAPDVSCSAQSGDHFAPGTTTVTCQATDAAGNVATGSFKVTVRYSVSGLFQPVDPSDLNTVKAGSTVPLKFTLRTASGAQIGDLAAVGSFAAKAAVCAPLLPDPVDFVTTGGTSLRYDPVAGQFIQNWKTPATKGCVRASVTLADGSVLSALFQLK